MLIPKASHLVERVAERLLKSGALDDSAAQLLRGSAGEPSDAPSLGGVQALQNGEASAPGSAAAAGAISERAIHATDPLPVTTSPQQSPPGQSASRRSLLFAPPPAAPGPLPRPNATAPAIPTALLSDYDPSPDDTDTSSAIPTSLKPNPPAEPLASPAILTQPRMSGPAALLERPTDFGASPPPFGPRAPVADPAAGMLQGPPSIDAMSLERAGMVDWSRTRTRISEEFRLVQRQILRSAFGPGAEPGFSNLLLVTSARPGEGKSFMATNLAGSIARQGDHHVLLVDADSKRDSICYSLGLAQARGLLDLAANPKLDPAPLMVKTPIERLSILPVGRERERSAELFSTKEMTRLIQSLGRRYADRLLILDAPPCLSTSDPAVLAQVVGQILFVVEADRTQRDEIEASLDLIQACPTITMVLNKQQISSRYTFGAYSSYYSS